MQERDTGHSFASYFKRAANPLVVLALLRERPMYGYEIAAEMEKRTDGVFTSGILYPILYKLRQKQFIEESGTEIADGRARNYYRLTDAGREYLETTLDEYRAISNAFRILTKLDDIGEGTDSDQ